MTPDEAMQCAISTLNLKVGQMGYEEYDLEETSREWDEQLQMWVVELTAYIEGVKKGSTRYAEPPDTQRI